jgi:hypothetical protein
MRYRVYRDMTKPACPVFRFWTSEARCAFVSTQNSAPFRQGDYEAECVVPPDLLNCGLYFVDVALMSARAGDSVLFDEKSALCIVAVEQSGRELDFAHTGDGVLRPRLDWAIRQIA